MVTRLTAMVIETNEVTFIDTPDRSECWMVRDGRLHALLLSCPHDKRQEMENFVAELQRDDHAPEPGDAGKP